MEPTKDAILSWVNAFFPHNPAPSFESLNDAHHFYFVLATAAKYCFPEDESSMPNTDNWILKKTNLTNLVRDMSRFGAVFLKAPDGFDLSTSNTIPLDRVARGEAVEGLVELSEYVITMAALAGSPVVVERLRGLSKERQMVLNATMKRIMTLHGFKKAVAPTSAVSAQAQLNSNSNNNNGAAGASNANASSSPTPFNNNNNGNTNVNSRGGGGFNSYANDDEDASVLRGELNVLRNELRDKSSALDTAESKCAVAEQQLEQLQSRYRTLLEETETRGETAKERELQKALTAVSKKEEELMQLRGTVSDLEYKVKQLRKDAINASEEVDKAKQNLEAEKKRIAGIVEDRNTAIREKSEVLNKLQVTEDRLKVIMTKRDELERELLKKEAEEHTRIREGIADSGTAAALAALATAIGKEGGLTSTTEVANLFKELNAKLSSKEQELERLKLLHGAAGAGGGGSDDDEGGDNVSNTSITEGPATSIGDSSAVKSSSSKKKGASRQDTSVISNANTSIMVDQSAVDAAVAAATAQFAAEMAELKQKLADSQNSFKSVEVRLAEQIETNQSTAETFAMQLKQAKDDAALELAKVVGSVGAEGGLQQELETTKEENEKMRRHVAELTEMFAQREEEFATRAQQQENEFRSRFETGKKAMMAEQAVVTSVVFHCGQRSLALQQRNLLGGAAVPHMYHSEGFNSLFRAPPAAKGGKGKGRGGAGGGYDEEMAASANDAESFMSGARLAGLWGTMKTGGVPVSSAATAPTKKR